MYFFGNTSVLSIPTNKTFERISRKLQMSLTIFWGLLGLPIPRPNKVSIVNIFDFLFLFLFVVINIIVAVVIIYNQAVFFSSRLLLQFFASFSFAYFICFISIYLYLSLSISIHLHSYYMCVVEPSSCRRFPSPLLRILTNTTLSISQK